MRPRFALALISWLLIAGTGGSLPAAEACKADRDGIRICEQSSGDVSTKTVARGGALLRAEITMIYAKVTGAPPAADAMPAATAIMQKIAPQSTAAEREHLRNALLLQAMTGADAATPLANYRWTARRVGARLLVIANRNDYF